MNREALLSELRRHQVEFNRQPSRSRACSMNDEFRQIGQTSLLSMLREAFPLIQACVYGLYDLFVMVG